MTPTPRPPLALAAPFTLGGLTLRNRLVATAHATAAVTDGAPTETDAACWRRLAQGGAAMVITGGTAVAPESTLPQRCLTEAWRPEIQDAVRRRTGAITDGGAVAVAQLVHLGRETLGAGTHYAPVSAAAVRSPREATAPHPLSTEEVRGVVDAFRICAANSVQAGFHQREQLAALGVRVMLGTCPGADDMAAYTQIVLATGAEEEPVPVPGELRTLTGTDFLRRYADVVPTALGVAVLDDGFGWWQGISAVESALSAGAREVTVITPGTGFETGLSPENRTQLMNRLTGAPVRVVVMSTVTSTTAESVRLRHVLDGRQTHLAADVLVTVRERRAHRPDFTPAAHQAVRAIGDCVVPRRIAHAVAEGRAAAAAVAARPL